VRGVVGTDGGMLETLMNENPARAVCRIVELPMQTLHESDL